MQTKNRHKNPATAFSVARVQCTLRSLRPCIWAFSVGFSISFLSFFLPVAHAEEKEKAVDVGESVPIIDVDQVIKNRQKLESPIYGTQEIFITKNGSAVIETQEFMNKEGLTLDDIVFQQTAVGPIARNETDKISGGQRIFAGDKAGYTQVLIYEKLPDRGDGKRELGRLLKIYRVTVSEEDLLGPLQEIRSLLRDVEGLEIKVVGRNIVLDGKIIVPSDIQRIKNVEARYGKVILPLYELSPLAWKLIAEKMEDEIAGGKDKPKEIRVTARNGRFFLDGQVDRNVDRDQAKLVCETFLKKSYYYIDERIGAPLDKIELNKENSDIGTCVMKIRLRPAQQDEPDQILAVRVDFVTLNRDYLKSFNFNWAPGMSLNGNSSYTSDTGKFLTSFTATLLGLFPKLETALSHGNARILKSATLLVRDGVTGNGGTPGATLAETSSVFLNTETVNPTTGAVTKEPKKYDVRTSIGITARSVPGFDKINLDIQVEQGEFVAGTTPGLTTNNIVTSVVVGNGESAAIGGLITERRKVSVVRDPADDKNMNFSLFEMGRGMDFSDQKSQFITFVTPSRMRTPAEGTENLKRKFRLRK